MEHPECSEAIFDLALDIQLPDETLKDAFVRARRLHLITTTKEQKDLMAETRYVPTCKSEVYDPDMYGCAEPEGDSTYIQGDEDE